VRQVGRYNQIMDAKHVVATGAKYLVKKWILRNPALLGGAIGGAIGFVVGGTSAHVIIKWFKRRIKHDRVDDQQKTITEPKKTDKLYGTSKILGNVAVHVAGAIGGAVVGASAGGVVGVWTAFTFKIVSTIRLLLTGYDKVKSVAAPAPVVTSGVAQ
jgi:uncharacterized membrane protein